MGDVLAFAEQREGTLRAAANETMTAARAVASTSGAAAHALVLGPSGIRDAASSLGSFGADRIHVAEGEAFGRYQPEAFAAATAEFVEAGDYDVVLFAASGQGKDLAPRVAALLGVPLASDVTGIEADGGSVTVVRPVYAGKAFARIRVNARPALVSVRPNTYQPTQSPGAGAVQAFAPSMDPAAPSARFVEFKGAGGDVLDVSEATIVVSGGRGMKGPENWPLLERLRESIGAEAALGASRAVVDAGWRPHGEQVGQTGKTVSPKLYFAIGISGAIQHLAGMRTAGTIVAVNKDPDAPIFSVADYGIVGDAFEVLPRLSDEIAGLRQEG